MKAIEVITSSLQVLREQGNLIMKYGFDKSNPLQNRNCGAYFMQSQ